MSELKEKEIELANNFLQEDHEDEFHNLLKTKCLQTDFLLKEATRVAQEMVSQINAMRTALSNKENEILRLNGMQEGHVNMINEIVNKKEKGE